MIYSYYNFQDNFILYNIMLLLISDIDSNYTYWDWIFCFNQNNL